MAPATDKRAAAEAPTLIGWQGVRFCLPAGWNLTAFSMERANGYLKVDSPGSMFVQVKWSEPARPMSVSPAGMLLAAAARRFTRPAGSAPARATDLRATLEAFLKQTEKQARKSRAAFSYRVRPEAQEAGGERTALHFTWSGGGQGQGKAWRCTTCGRVVIAQVVGQGRDDVGAVASQLFSTFRDHGEDGWETWALYDLVATVPDDFRLARHNLMSGYLKLEFERAGGERLQIDRWGLANITRKRFSLREWLEQQGQPRGHRATMADASVQGHPAVTATGKVCGPVALAKAFRASFPSLRPALWYDARCWECPETNKLYAIQVWRRSEHDALAEVIAERCECH